MILLQNPKENLDLDLELFTNLSSLQKHEYTESLIREKINLTYREAIDFFITSLSNHEKLSTAFENYREFKDKKISEITDDIDLLLYACVDKFTGILYLVINQTRDSLSFYELDSHTQNLTDKGSAPTKIHCGGFYLESTLKTDFHELEFLTNCFEVAIQEAWGNSTFTKTQKDLYLNEAILRYPQSRNELEKNRDKPINISESFHSIATLRTLYQIYYCPPYQSKPLSKISSFFNATHTFIDPKDIEMVIDLKRQHTKSSLKLA